MAVDERKSPYACHVFACVNLAQLEVSWGEHELDSGRAPDPYLEEAIRSAQEALRINAGYSSAHVILAESHRVRARELTERGADPLASVRAARRAALESLEINSSDAAAYVSLGRVGTLEARWRAACGEDPAPALDEAKAHLARAIELDPAEVSGYVAMAELCRRAAGWSGGSGDPALPEIEQGLRMTQEALALCAGHGESLALQAALLLRQAECETQRALRDGLLGRAEEALEAALRCNGHLRRKYAPETERIRELTGVQGTR